MIPVPDGWLVSRTTLLSARVRITGNVEGQGTSLSAARALSQLSDQVTSSPGGEFSSGNLLLVGVVYAHREGICGNGFCEVGERPVEGGSQSLAKDPCASDCPLEIMPCPGPSNSTPMCSICTPLGFAGATSATRGTTAASALRDSTATALGGAPQRAPLWQSARRRQ
uniref:Uncharacterized protein n=1 Tax=Tetraselmis sp. GSL018 TaxID=582737 RepID=A0A061RBL3_9CHLO